MNEDEIFIDETQETTQETTEESSSQNLSYDDIYNATYNAFIDANTELKIREAEESVEDSEIEEDLEEEETTEQEILNVNCVNLPAVQGVNVRNFSDLEVATSSDAAFVPAVEFATNTDATLYTVTTQSAIGSADAQSVAILLEQRNIMLIFFLIWLAIYLIKMIKNTVMKFTKGKGDSI